MTSAAVPRARVRRGGVAGGVLAAAALLVAVLAVLDVTQGTASLSPADVVRGALGLGTERSDAVVTASRLPRAGAGILVGVALGVAGGALQGVTRNVLAAPDTLAVDAGASAALAVAAVTGLALPLVGSWGLALVGGLLAAGLVLALSGLGSGTVRLVLAGSALALGLGSLTQSLLLLFPQQTVGIYAWGQGSIAQNGGSGVQQMAPIVAVGVVLMIVIARRLDALALGDDAARGIGIRVGATRTLAVGLAVLLAAAAVTLAGPLGFVGLAAPALVRPLRRRIPALTGARLGLPLVGLVGAAVVLGSDVLLRAVLPPGVAVAVPTGSITTVVGAATLVVIAFRAREADDASEADRIRIRRRATVLLIAAACAVVLAAAVVGAVLLGDARLLLGDLVNWAAGRAGPTVSYVLETRLPRVVAALLAGAALALAGTLVQAVTRNPLAEPGVLGVSGGASLAAVLLVTTVPLAAPWLISGVALVGAGLAGALVFGLAARGGFRRNRLVLIGVGVAAAATAVISLLIVLTDPYNATKALTWLSGSTYGRELPDSVPLAVVLVAGLAVAVVGRHGLDLLSLDEDTPRLLGVRSGRARLGFLAVAVALAGVSAASVGAVGFVGLVAPHAARALVGRPHRGVIPVAVLLGAALVVVADALGRTVVAPSQLGAGVLTAAIGTPYFLYLLLRTRR